MMNGEYYGESPEAMVYMDSMRSGDLKNVEKAVVRELLASPDLHIYRSMDAFKNISYRSEKVNRYIAGDSAESMAFKFEEIAESQDMIVSGFIAGIDNHDRELLVLPGVYYDESNQVFVRMKDIAKEKVEAIFLGDKGAGGEEIFHISDLRPEFGNEVLFTAHLEDIERILIRDDIVTEKEQVVLEFAKKYSIPVEYVHTERVPNKEWIMICRNFLPQENKQ